MRKTFAILVPVLFLVGLVSLSVMAEDTLVQFEGGIGVIPVSNVVGTAATGDATRNTVAGSTPAASRG